MAEAVEAISGRALREAERSFNLDVFDGSDGSGGESIAKKTSAKAVAAALALPVASDRRVVILRSAEKVLDAAPLPSYLSDPSPQTVLILWAGDLNARRRKSKTAKKLPTAPTDPQTPATKKNRVSKADIVALLEGQDAVVEFKMMSEKDAEVWAAERASAAGIKIQPAALKLLIALKGTSAREILQEIRKISVGLGDRTEAGPDDLYDLIGVSREYNVYELTDKVGWRDASRSQEILLRMLEGGDKPVGIVTALTRHIIDLWRIKEASLRAPRGKEGAAVPAQMQEWIVKKLQGPAKKFAPGEFRNCFKALLEAEVELKSSSGQEVVTIMTRLIYELTRRA